MIFSGLELMGDVPFSDVIIHTTVLAPDGRRMSKSLGTGMDPLDLVDEHGADATRYGLLKISSSQDVRFSIGAVEEGRKLANKLWNASRLLLSAGTPDAEPRPEAVEERWIFARLDETRAEVEADFAAFDFAHAADRLYHLTFDDFCDWYLEAIKPRLEEPAVRATALEALVRLLKLLHPVMPHVSEEIWSHLPARETRLIVAPWPAPDERFAETSGRSTAFRTLPRSSGAAACGPCSRATSFGSSRQRRAARKTDGDASAEIDRLEKEIARAEGMLANERFTSKAPPEVVEAEREKLARYRRELDALRD